MEVQWDDGVPLEFLDDISIYSRRISLNCSAASKRLAFKEVGVEDIVTTYKKKGELKTYTTWPKRIEMFKRRAQNGRPIGTLFCRAKKNGKWFLKDGNHRFKALKELGVTKFRIAYDPENMI